MELCLSVSRVLRFALAIGITRPPATLRFSVSAVSLSRKPVKAPPSFVSTLVVVNFGSIFAFGSITLSTMSSRFSRVPTPRIAGP